MDGLCGRLPKACCYCTALVVGIGEQSTTFISYGGAIAGALVWGWTDKYSRGWMRWRGFWYAKHAQKHQRQTTGPTLAPGGVGIAASLS